MDQTTTQMPDPPPPSQGHQQPAPPPTPPPSPGRGPLRRSSTDRHLGGVSAALASLLGVSSTTARVIFVIAAFFGGIGLFVYAAMWVFLPDEYGRVLIRGGAVDTREAATAAIVAAIASTSVSWWSFDNNGFLIPLLVGVGVYLLARRPEGDPLGTATAPPPPPAPGSPAPPAGPGTPVDSTTDTDAAGEFDPTDGLADGSSGGYGPPPEGPESPDAHHPPVPASPTRTPRAPAFLGPLTVGVAAVAAGVLALLHATDVVDIQASTVLTTVLGIVAVGLITSAWFGRARGLVWLGLLLLPAVVLSTAVDRIDIRGGWGEREITPTSVDDLRTNYRLGAGQQALDLTDLDVGPGERLPDVTVSQGAGRLQVFVPEDWNVTADIDVDLGEVELNEPRRPTTTIDGDAGVDRRLEFDGDEGAPSIDLDLDLTVGLVEVNRERP